MSEISKDQIISAAEKRFQLAESMLSGDLEPLQERTWSIELALASNALLALRKEREAAVPVATAHRLVNKITGSVHEWKLTPGVVPASEGDTFLIETLPLYTAPPAQPVAVPDEDDFEKAFRSWNPDKTGPYVKHQMKFIWEACRDAMLAAPGKQPLSLDTLAGALRNAPLAPSDNQGRKRDSSAPVISGWIPCSERMPDDGVSVLAYCKCGDNFSGIYTMRAPVIRSKNSRKDDSLAHHERVTHWMPLPAAPGKEGE